MGSGFIANGNYQHEGLARVTEPPPAMLAKQEEMEAWYRDQGPDCHAFSVMCAKNASLARKAIGGSQQPIMCLAREIRLVCALP